jgi:hypothetical protein
MNTTKTHPLNVSYLVVGLVFLGIAASWALRTSGVVDTGDVRWLVPAVLLVAGAAGLVGFAAKGISRSRQDGRAVLEEEPWSPPYAEDTTEPTTRLDIEPDTETTRIEGENR